MSGRKPSEKKMKRVCLFLEEEQVEYLQTHSDQTGVPMSVLMRRALEQYISILKSK
jgi:predicted DNA-binding protein